MELVAVINVYMELYVDYVQYLDVSTNTTETFTTTKGKVMYLRRFYANEDGSDKLIKWEFVSDSSVELLGFSVLFHETGMFKEHS